LNPNPRITPLYPDAPVETHKSPLKMSSNTLLS